MPISYRKINQGQALVITRPGKITVSFTPRFVAPFLNRVEVMDISVRTIEIDRRGKEGLICADNIRADIKVTFFVRVNKTEEDVLKVAQSIGCARASDAKTLEELFNAKFSEALKTVGKQLEFVDLYTKRDEFRDQIIRVIGRDLNGYFLEDAAIDYLEQTPLSSLDEYNILDAQGIRKITELTAQEHVRTNEFQNFEKKQIKKQDVEAREAILELERQQADAEAKQAREIATVRAREEAETAKVASEERLRSETARIKTDEEVAIQEENKQRQVEVAEKNRERVIAVETERVEKERQLEAISRERETELQRIAKEKEVEQEKKLIADVIRERVAVDRTVAEEEERIKELRVVEEASRTKKATIINAEAEAQERLVKDIKAAEAAEEAAKFKGREQLILAEADLEASNKKAQAKIRMAEGIQAEAAAEGLAQVRVKEQDAAAIEKVGMAEAAVTKERGTAEAVALREKGVAEATAVREKLNAEATGIESKAKAMHELDTASREHEEYRLRLDKDRAVELEEIKARIEVAKEQAEVLSQALKSAKIDIVGGESIFFDRLVNSVSMGKSVDGFFSRSEAASAALDDYLSGKKSLPQDLKEALAGVASSSEDVKNLTLTAFLSRLMAKDGATRDKATRLLQAAKELGLEDLEV